MSKRLIQLQVSLFAYAASTLFNIALADMAQVRYHEEKIARLENSLIEANDSVRMIETKISSAKNESDEASTNYKMIDRSYKKLLEIEDENPGFLSEDKIAEKRMDRIQAHRYYQRSLKDISILKSDLGDSSIVLRSIEDSLGKAVAVYKQHANEEIEARLAKEKDKFETVQEVHAYHDYQCHDDQTGGYCKKKAREMAERNAIEKGAVVTVTSITDMRDLQIESENIQSEVNASIISRKVIKNGVRSVIGFEYEMLAIVQPHISDSVLDKMRNAIAIDVMGKYHSLLGRSSFQPSTRNNTNYLAELEKKEQARRAELELTRKEEARIAREEQVHRQQLARKEEKQRQQQVRLEKRQAERVSAARRAASKPPVMVF